ncbi:MAG: TonB-dependent receptor [Phenylobacterium sp.]|nr:MAG: TonB-dependent receptor [Phenylobacterium sp.]
MFAKFSIGLVAAALAVSAAHAEDAADAAKPKTLGEVVVTASRTDLLGKAESASQGSITHAEVELRPIFRIGQLYETVPGLVVTIHSGEGKANQYLLRGFNLDHGTDFASFVDSMPVNRPTNAHGQGYSDQNFLLPQIVGGLDFTKGPYYAALGDFAAVGSTHVRLLDDLQDQASLSVGTLRDQEAFLGGTYHFDADNRVWGALDLSHLDGPWSPAEDFRKVDAAARFSHGNDADGYSLTAMAYSSAGGLLTDQPLRAIEGGLIDRFGTLDPTDRSRSERYSLSGHYGVSGERWDASVNAYAIHSTMTLWNDFTHFLFDDINGDQEQQDESRTSFGGDAAFTRRATLMGVETDTTVGLQDRYDSLFIDRRHTLRRTALDYCDLAQPGMPAAGGLPAPADAHATDQATAFAAVGGACNADRVKLNDLGLYVENTTYWTDWLRTVVGLREEAYWASDHSLTTGFQGSASQTLLQPKASLVLGPWFGTELYVSAGRGFHSDDVRGVFGTVPLEGLPGVAGRTPFLSPATGEEVGLRTDIIPKVQVQVAVFQEDFNSEQTYDADQGEDSASAPSRRQGVELSAQYHPFAWLEFNTDLAVSRARYRASAQTLASFGLDGPFIANAPTFIGSFGVLVDKLGPWFGGLQWRDLGPYPISDGDEFPRDKGYSEINLDVGYKLNPALKVQLSVYNLLDSHADAAAYFYQSRATPTETPPACDAAQPTGCFQVHPLEPRSARLTVTANF